MARLYSGGFGHNPSAKKMYTYWGDKDYNVGENVNVPVTNPKTGKTYNTMFTIYETDKPDTTWGQAVEDRAKMGSRDGRIKWINGRSVTDLPSFNEYGSKKAWAEESEAAWREPQIQEWMKEARFRLNSFDISQTNNSEAVYRLTQLL